MNHPINLSYLKYFCDAVTQNSISEAAKINFVTQSAVSQGIHKLEISLGVPLATHTRQKFQVTEEGRIVFEQARYVFKAVQNIREGIKQSKETVTGTLKFVSTNSLGMSFIAAIYKKIRDQFPHVAISYSLGGLSYIRNALKQGTAEFAIVVYDKNFDQFSKRLLKKGVFHLYQSTDAPPYLFEQGIFVDYFSGMHVESLNEYFIHSNRPPLQLQAELASWEVVARFTEMSIGVGFFPDYLLTNNRYPDMKIYPLEHPPFEYEICAIYNKNEKLSRAARTFLDLFTLY